MSVSSQGRFIPFVSQPTEDLLMWKDVKKTGIYFGACNAIFFFFRFSKTPLVSIALYLIGLAVGILTAWARFGSSVGRPMPLLPAYLREGVSEVDYKSYVDRLKPYLDSLLAKIGFVVSSKDFKFNLKMVVGCFVAAKLLSFCNPLTLLYAIVLAAFIVPKLYEQNKELVDDYLAKGKDQANKYVVLGKEHMDRGLSSAKAKVVDFSNKVPALKPFADKLQGAKKTA